MINTNRVSELFNKYLNQTITEDERQEFFNYVDDPSCIEKIDALISNSFENQQERKDLKIESRNRILASIVGEDEISLKKPKQIKLWSRFVAAASVVLIASIGFYFYKSNSHIEQQSVYVNDVNPGHSGATLTLGNGQKILINEANAGNIANQSGVEISKTADGQIIYKITDSKSGVLEYNTLTTSRGEETQVRLPDGSLVFLNAASSITFPSNFINQSKRKVTLTGEAYFEVSKDKAHPFLVKTENQTVTVLGTHFNINGYKNKTDIITTLLEGSVKIDLIGDLKISKIIKPGDQATYAKKSIKIEKADIEATMAWKNGYFRFNDEPIQSVMDKLSRWYDIDVDYIGNMSNEGFNGKISRSKNISEVLNALASTNTIHFKVEGRRVTVIK